MDLGLFSVCIMICLIGTTHPSGNGHCSCSKIPKINNTADTQEACNHTPGRLRYNCTDGYVRKAGTSNLLKCVKGEWIKATLECIPDPSRSTAKPSTTTQLSNRYETSPGLRNKSSSESTDSEGNQKPSTPGTMESTTAQYTRQSSTHSTVSTIETNPTQKDKHKSMVTGVHIGVTVVILTVSVMGLIFVIYMYQRKNRRIPISLEAEMEPMNGALAKVLYQRSPE